MSFFLYILIGVLTTITFLALNYKFKWYTKANYGYEEPPVLIILFVALFIWPVFLLILAIFMAAKYAQKLLP